MTRTIDPPDSRSDRADGPPVEAGRPHSAELLVGTVLGGRYRIERVIGEGGMGTVYQAEHTHMRKRLAVKVLHPEMSRLPEVVARFEREAMAAAHIEHPNVAAATDFGKLDDGSFFLVLEYVEGTSLRDAITAGPPSLPRALGIARQIALALGRAHALGIVHRDLKPENVMLVAREECADFVKVLDFGIAKVPVGELGSVRAAPEALTQVGMVYGTPEYMAPEQALGQQVDARADLYSLGVILFEMVTGARPFEDANKVVLLGMHVTAPVPTPSQRAPLREVPPRLDAVIGRLLAKDSGARFADAQSLVDALDACAAELSAHPSHAEPGKAPPDTQPNVTGPDAASEVSTTMAVGPTSLAHLEGVAGATLPSGGRRASDLFPMAFAWTQQHIRASGPRTWAALGAALVVILGLSFAARALRGSDTSADAAVASGAAEIRKGNYASGINVLAPVEREHPDRADVHAWLERAYASVHDARATLREADSLARLDPSSIDSRILDDVRNAAQTKDEEDEAFNLLESTFGARGIDALYDLTYGAASKMSPQLAARARRSLADPAVRLRASPALAILLDMRESKSCDDKRALLDRAHDQGDARLLPLLQSYQARSGCGFLGVVDCYACLHHDTRLSDAMDAIEQRGTPAPGH